MRDKEKKKVADKQYSLVHKKEKKKYDEEYGRKNKEKIKAWHQDYYKRNKGKILEKERKYQSENKEKIKAGAKKYYEKNKNRIIKRTVAWGRKNKDKIKEYSRRWRCKHIYKISEERLAVLCSSQRTCQICGKRTKGRELCIDHCHETGRVRGLLCDTCNWGIGSFKNSPALLARAITYLEESKNGSKPEYVTEKTIVG